MTKIVYVQKINLSGMVLIGFVGAPFVLLALITSPLWKPSYVDSQRDTPNEELERAKYYDEAGGWVGWFDRDEADRRARESYEAVIDQSSSHLTTWVAHHRLGQMAYDDGDFKQAIDHWENAQPLSDSSWQQAAIRQSIWKGNCRVAGGDAGQCLTDSLNVR